MNKQNEINRFFDAYAKRFNQALAGKEVDVDATVSAFSECFIEASPLGIVLGKNDESFRKAIPKGYDFYKKIGTKAMQIVSKDIQPLDEFHSMVRVHWNALYEQTNGTRKQIAFDVVYLLQHIGTAFKIFAYITGDEQKALQENGLIPKS